MALNDPKKKRDENGVQIGHLRTIPGTGLDSLLKGTDARMQGYAQRVREGALAEGAKFVNPANPASMQASPSARLTAPATVRPPGVLSAGGGATPTYRLPASPAVTKPDFSRVQGSMLAPPKSLAEQPAGIQRRVVHGVPTFTGTGAFAPAQAQQAPAFARPTLVNPTIAPVQTPGVVNQSEWSGNLPAKSNMVPFARDMSLWTQQKIPALPLHTKLSAELTCRPTNPYTYSLGAISLALTNAINDAIAFSETTSATEPVDAEIQGFATNLS